MYLFIYIVIYLVIFSPFFPFCFCSYCRSDLEQSSGSIVFCACAGMEDCDIKSEADSDVDNDVTAVDESRGDVKSRGSDVKSRGEVKSHGSAVKSHGEVKSRGEFKSHGRDVKSRGDVKSRANDIKSHGNDVKSRGSDDRSWPFECPTCRKRFKYQGSVDLHVETHHNRLNQPRHECSTCGKRFLTEGRLLRHLGTHLPEEHQLHQQQQQGGVNDDGESPSLNNEPSQTQHSADMGYYAV